MGFDGREFARRLAERTARLAELQTTQPYVPEGLPSVSPATGQLLPGIQTIATLSSAPWTLIGGAVWLGVSQSLAVNLPVGTAVVGIAIQATKVLASLQAAGQTTGVRYYGPIPSSLGASNWVTFYVNSTADAVLNLTGTGPATPGAQIHVYASALPVPYPELGQAASAASLPVVLATDQVATPWQGPNLAPIFISRASAGTTAVLAGVASQIVRVFGGQLVVSVVAAGGSATLQDSAGNTLAQMRTDSLGQFAFNLSGAPLAVAAGLQFVTVGAGTSGVVVAASQA